MELIKGIIIVAFSLTVGFGLVNIASNPDKRAKLLHGIWKHLLRPALVALIIGFFAAIITQDTAVTSFGAIGGWLAGYFIDRS